MRILLDRSNRASPKVADWFNKSKLQQLILYKNNIIIYNHDPTYQPSLVINALKTKKRYTIQNNLNVMFKRFLSTLPLINEKKIDVH
jgi:hypothetical protein